MIAVTLVPVSLGFDVVNPISQWFTWLPEPAVAVLGIVLTMAYLFKMMRSLFYGPMDQKYSHSHDAVAFVDRRRVARR